MLDFIGGSFNRYGKSLQQGSASAMFRGAQTPLEALFRPVIGAAGYAAGTAMRGLGIGMQGTSRAINSRAIRGIGNFHYSTSYKLGTEFLHSTFRNYTKPFGRRSSYGLTGILGIGVAVGSDVMGQMVDTDSTNVARRVSEGSAYESDGASSYGYTVRRKMPMASGDQVMGMHNAR